MFVFQTCVLDNCLCLFGFYLVQLKQYEDNCQYWKDQLSI